MRYLILIAISIVSCTNFQKQNVKSREVEDSDTIVKSHKIKSSLSQEVKYFLILNKKPSNFKVVFKEHLYMNKRSVYVTMQTSLDTNEHKKRMAEFAKIITKASDDFVLDTIVLNLGQLSKLGGVSAEITKEYQVQHRRDSCNWSDYKMVAELIQKSSFCKQLNWVFKPYSMRVDHVAIEKLFGPKYSNCLIDCGLTYVTLVKKS